MIRYNQSAFIVSLLGRQLCCVAILFLSIASMGGVSGCSKSPDNNPTLAGTNFNFSPAWVGASGPSGILGTPVPPKDLLASPESGKITLTWQMPKTYHAANYRIGYRIFRKMNPTPTEGWDFSNSSTLDWATDLATLKAIDCDADGSCSYTDNVGGPSLVSYAVMAYWDISNFSSSHSVDVDAATTSLENTTKLSFAPGFMDAWPIGLIGAVVGANDPAGHTPNSLVFSLAPTATPWYQYGPSDTSLSLPQWASLSAPLFPGLTQDGLNILLPDQGFNRGVHLTKGNPSECTIFKTPYVPFCLSILLSNPFVGDFALGQTNITQQLPFAQNALPASRKFSSRDTSVQTAVSGGTYTFVADQQRILVRRGDIYSCASDSGEVSTATSGPEGVCGFQWSIGTFSPRQRCHARSDSTPATGGTDCTEADLAYSLADSTPPTDYSLRFPGTPVIVGPHLYIPDAGNSRLLRLANFETALKTCGQILPVGSTIPNDFCHFDQVVGQYGASTTDPARFTIRSCIRGGEEGGFDGLNPVSAQAPFVDPTGGNGSGGAACRLDLITANTGGTTVVRRSRLAGDVRDEFDSMMSPSTGLLAEPTERSFRAPLHMKYDSAGRIYVLDMGYTRVQSASGDDVATLPPRIMIWNRDPFGYQTCVPTDPKAAIPSCRMDQNNKCTGTGCLDRQCDTGECNASIFIGQPGALYGFTHQAGQQLGVDVTPKGYYPLSGFDIGYNLGMVGLWAATGVDARILHWTTPTQTTAPDVHNALGKNVTDASYRSGIFTGVTVDGNIGEVTGWDMKLNIGITWRGIDSSVGVLGGTAVKNPSGT